MTIFFVSVFGVIALLWVLYWRWSTRIESEIQEGAQLEWEALRQSEPEVLDGYNEERFGAVYRRVHFPRFPGYALAATAAFLGSLPLTLGLLGASVWAGEKLGILPQPVEMAKHIPIGESKAVPVASCTAECQVYLAEAFSGFYFFFAIIAVWLLIVAYFMRRYHARRPGYLRDEILRNRPS